MPNVQVTHDNDPNNARSESAILVNPNNPQQVVASSKKFKNIHTYDFTLATEYSSDGGRTWNDSATLALPAGATVMTDPTLAWDDAGNLFLVGLVGNNPPTWNTIGIAVYKSTDGGATWGAANLIHSSVFDDKQWAAGDTNPASPFHGRIYAVWDDGSAMRFARSKDHGGDLDRRRARARSPPRAWPATPSRPRSTSRRTATCTSSGSPGAPSRCWCRTTGGTASTPRPLPRPA